MGFNCYCFVKTIECFKLNHVILITSCGNSMHFKQWRPLFHRNCNIYNVDIYRQTDMDRAEGTSHTPVLCIYHCYTYNNE
jgi:hypothetical protein